MEKQLVLRGAFVGTVAGLLAYLFARILAEPQINKAIDYESGREAAQRLLDKAAGLPAEAPGSDVFSRTVQENVGLGVGMVLFGLAMGVLFAVVYAICLGRVGNLRPRSLSLCVASAALLGMYLIPFLKYPANPPSIGNPDTIKQRSALYLTMVLGSIAVLFLAVWLGRRLQARLGNWNATLVACGFVIVMITILMIALPPFGHLASNHGSGNNGSETPVALRDAHGTIVYPGFPADVLFNFRLTSIGAQLLLWAAIGVGFAPLAERLLRPPAARERERTGVT
ncbi:MAG TPA: CbtA family protein [Jatrophihabitantaceae bacterium]|nr:CbtA family protein [Jatrophihabitantaceae bacterium]